MVSPPRKSRQLQPSISIRDFIEKSPPPWEMALLAGSNGAEHRRLNSPRIQKLGLALAGFPHYVHPGRVQIVGQSEIFFLDQLELAERRAAIERLDLNLISCIVITTGLNAPDELLAAAEGADLPVLRTSLVSSEAINEIVEYLQRILAPTITQHGVLMDIYGTGVLLRGPSGVGKSECALDLITRGHLFVSDDMVELRRVGPKTVVGSAPELLQDHLEIRGLGILKVSELFGISALSGEREISLVIEFVPSGKSKPADRLQPGRDQAEILEVKIPSVELPVSPGRNLSTLVETAVRVHLLKQRGYDSTAEFLKQHDSLRRRNNS
ncbi:MAG: HPr(Ser) kinase/phosphatase [Pyrinomonadaceae bacterium]